MNEQVRDEFAKLLANNDYLQQAYVGAIKAGLSEEEGLMSLLVVMDRLNKRALSLIADEIMHGMQITQEVAAVRNAILGVAYGEVDE